MKHQTFENYLQDEFLKDYEGIKDDCEDAFDGWLANKDVAEMLELGETYGVKMYEQGCSDTLNEVNAFAVNND